ncbi:hypothetical protein CDO42_34815, partial [Pseudomonas aeruginosa]
MGDSARITPPGTDPSAGGELGVATGNTLPRIDLGADGYQLLPPRSNRTRCDRRATRLNASHP